MLAEKGIRVLDDDADINSGDIVVIRSHGVAPQVIEELTAQGYDIFDATCPKVAYVHKIVAKLSRQGYAIIIVGDENHSEVLGIKGEIFGDVAVINTPQQVENLPDWDKVAIVAQTTMDYNTFESVVNAAQKKYDNLMIKNTLCSETSYRQDEIAELAQDCDAFVVIGGKNSANTRRLYQLASKTGLPTFWVETVSEIDVENYSQIEKVAVVAGASTPHWVIDRVVERLETIHSKFLPPWRWRWLKFIAYFFLRSNALASLSAGIFSFMMAMKTELHAPILRAMVVFGILFAILNLYEYREWQGLALMDPSKVQFVRNNRKFLIPISIIFLLGAIIISFLLNLLLGVLTCVITAIILIYWWVAIFERIFPAFIKDGMMLVGWIFIIWVFGTRGNLQLLIPIAMFGAIRGLTMGLKELETDRILQRKSITSALGEKFSILLGIIPLIFGIISLILLKLVNIYSGILIGSIAMWILTIMVAFRLLRKGTYIETLADFIVILAAII